MDAPREGLSRAFVRRGAEFRAARADEGGEAGIGTLIGHFAVFDTLTVIDSYWEGTFREQFKKGAFVKTMKERREQIRCVYEHGYDPQFGYKPLGPPEVLEEDSEGAYYEVPLFDTQLNREHVVPAASAKQLGASFAFQVMAESWDDEPDDGGLPIRTITEVKLFEFGPCPFAAYDEATAGMRSAISPTFWRALSPSQREELASMFSRTTDLGAAAAGTARGAGGRDLKAEPPAGTRTGTTRAALAERLAHIDSVIKEKSTC